MERRSVLLAWSVGLLAVLAVVGSSVFAIAVLGQTGSNVASELWGLSWMGFPVVGALIAARRPDTRIGWLLIGVGAAVAIGRFGATFAVLPAEPLSLGAYLARTLHSFEMVAFGLLALALLHFPTDRLPSARWRIPLAVRAGRQPGGGYVHETDAAYDLVDGAVQPFIDDLRRRARLGMHEAAVKLALGVLTGLYRCRDPRDGTVLAYAGTDTPEELAAWVVDEAARAQVELPTADVAAACPGWERLG